MMNMPKPQTETARPWYAKFALFSDRTEPTYVVGGFTPPAGTTPAEVATLRWWSGETVPRTVIASDERAALCTEEGRSMFGEPTTTTYVVIRYDDLPGARTQDSGCVWPGPGLRDTVAEWVRTHT